ncbi:hypothetical protein [Catellatospora sp. NPDC049133]|uniref:hypothetical protein n=1 Tax=Catellatospora sp. NPDC049133 TaxID=3155499 RepID=UPI003405E608
MNRYGRTAMEHWRDELPDRYKQIADPESYFTQLGEQVATRIAQVETELAELQPSTGDYLGNLGNLRTAHSQAEEIVLNQMVYLTEELDAREQTSRDSEGWTPLAEDPTDPWWAEQERDS